MPDPNLAGMPRRSRSSTQPDRHWITTLNGTRLREARIERGLSRNELAAEAGVSLSTMARLESQRAASCHRATLYRIAATLADDPRSVISALVITDWRQTPARSGCRHLGQCRRGYAAAPFRPGQIRSPRRVRSWAGCCTGPRWSTRRG